MDVTKLMDTPLTILEAWLPALDKEIEISQVSIANLETQIQGQELSISHTKDIKFMVETAINVKKILKQTE